MKTLLLSIAMLVSVVAVAQSDKYVQAMKANMAKLDSAKTVDDYVAISNAFERIAKAEKDKWLPYYYAALTQTLGTYRLQGAPSRVDAMLDKADDLLISAEMLNPNVSELYCVKSMVYSGRLMVDPQVRGQEFGQKSEKALQQAIEADPGNPRPYVLMGQSKMYMPTFWGGGKDKAKPLFEKSIELFASFKPADSLAPSWGKRMAESLLKQCE